MRVVGRADEFAAGLEAARREAAAAFGDPRVFLEKALVAPRHVEIQVIADAHGAIVHLGERDCSIQRRHQKVVEEAPSPAVDPALRARLGAAAVAAARAVGYVGAGTVEFLLDRGGAPYFLEMNTRLQVEHPITEAVTGLDLVHLQLAVAAGEPLPFDQDDPALAPRGHAIECRIYAEDPAAGFLPTGGTLRLFAPPTGPGIRNDVGVATGDEVGVAYDPQLAKLIIHAADRPAALDRLARALRDYAILGVTTNLPFLNWLVAHPEFRTGRADTDFLAREWSPEEAGTPPLPREVLLGAAALDLLDREERAAQAARPTNPWQTAGAWRAVGAGATLRLTHGDLDYRLTTARTPAGEWAIDLGASRATVTVERRGPGALVVREGARVLALHGIVAPEGLLIGWEGQAYRLTKPAPPTVETTAADAVAGGTGALTAPMPGTIIALHVALGDTVAANQPLLVLEAMKMEHTIAAPRAGVVRRLPHLLGATVAAGASLVEIDD